MEATRMRKTNTPPTKGNTEPTCASCDNLSIAGRYCYHWNCPASLESACRFHTKMKARI